MSTRTVRLGEDRRRIGPLSDAWIGPARGSWATSGLPKRQRS
jgi:hypothetical protein